ncbi:SRPBCC family protein [Amycolatopsis suaedae]|uniref:SRPBCC domain-containing protein n=1 Tax=Amycolatopsis suaedae TaxID=2510978 RepID=A0A4Q7J131_9PSEU|nr:SRPBCC domain-containing protein [Amycolatopsis suaedae]RZQ59644.1 SRPBCC domain-containing protein [Amycolatopsis suaedae]
MSNTEYLTATMTVDRTPEEVFQAITNVRGWWTENLIGDSAALYDEFVFTDDSAHPGEAAQGSGGIRFARFQLTEVVPGRRVVWHCVDSYLSFIDDHGEWTGTDAVFDITTGADGTTLRFVHEGLTAAGSACFEACSRGWTFYITKSLPQLITTGTGQPIPGYRR